MTRADCIAFFVILFAPSLIFAASSEIEALPAILAGDTLTVRVPFAAIVSAEDSLSMVNGEALSIVCRLELWQKRKMWFDRLRQELIGYVELSYDRWGERFRAACYCASGNDFSLEFPQLDSLVSAVANRLAFPFTLESNDYARESYIAFNVELKYLTPDQLGDLKDWLFSGKKTKTTGVRNQQQSLPGKLVNMALNSTGFRNRSYLKSSLSFYPGQISEAIKFPTSLNK